MAGEKPRRAGNFPVEIFLFAAALAAYWAWYQFQYSLNGNNAVMLEFARRMAEGGRIGIDFYDINPPLSIIIYVPVILLERLTGLPVWYGLTVYALSLALLSSFLFWRILKGFPFIESGEAKALTLLYFFAYSFMANVFYGERDLIVLLGLVPLVTAQFALNTGHRPPDRVLYPALLFGAVAVLIKPHYGLLPFLLVMMRGPHPRNMFRPDLFVLAGSAFIYGLLLLTVFRPYIDVIMPDVLRFYAGKRAGDLNYLPPLFLLLALLGGALSLGIDRERRRFTLFFIALGFTLLVAYIAQFKGYYYHLIPAEIAVFLAFTSLLIFLMRPVRYGAATVVIGGLGFLAMFYPVRYNYPTHAEYRALPLSRLVAGCDATPCPFFMTQEFTYITYETALYEDTFHASRFPSLWFMPVLECRRAQRDELTPAEREETDALFAKYAAMVTEDLKRWRPEMVVLGKSRMVCPGGLEADGDFAAFFSGYPPFRDVWHLYEFDREMEVNRRPYFYDTSADYDYSMNFEIYRRKEN